MGPRAHTPHEYRTIVVAKYKPPFSLSLAGNDQIPCGPALLQYGTVWLLRPRTPGQCTRIRCPLIVKTCVERKGLLPGGAQPRHAAALANHLSILARTLVGRRPPNEGAVLEQLIEVTVDLQQRRCGVDAVPYSGTN